MVGKKRPTLAFCSMLMTLHRSTAFSPVLRTHILPHKKGTVSPLIHVVDIRYNTGEIKLAPEFKILY